MVKKVPAQVPKCNPIIRHSKWGGGICLVGLECLECLDWEMIGHQPLWPDLTQIGADSLA